MKKFDLTIFADSVKRHNYGDYYNLGTAAAPDWNLMGTGFTTLDESPGAQSESTKYINEESSSSEVTSYETEFSFEADQIKNENIIDDIYTIARDHKTGGDAEREYVRTELWKDYEDADGNVQANCHPARKFTVAVTVDDISGEDKQQISGTFGAVGDPVQGYFNTAEKTFTEVTA